MNFLAVNFRSLCVNKDSFGDRRSIGSSESPTFSPITRDKRCNKTNTNKGWLLFRNAQQESKKLVNRSKSDSLKDTVEAAGERDMCRVLTRDKVDPLRKPDGTLMNSRVESIKSLLDVHHPGPQQAEVERGELTIFSILSTEKLEQVLQMKM